MNQKAAKQINSLSLRCLKATGVFKEVSIVREQINIPLD